MADISIDEQALRIELTVAERLLALHGRDIDIPVSKIVTIEAVEEIYGELRGLRIPGTGIPGVLAIGTWRGRADGAGFHDFAVIHRRGPGVVITAENADYDRVLISTDEPEAMVAQLRS